MKRIYLFLVFFFFCAFSLSAQVEMDNFRLRLYYDGIGYNYFVHLKDSLCSCPGRSAWRFFSEFEDLKPFSSVLFKVSELLEREVYVKCDTIVPVKIFITYNADNEPCDIVYLVPEVYIDYFSEPVFNEIYSIFKTMSPDLSMIAFLDNWWNRFSKVTRQQSGGLVQLIFNFDKRLWDWLKEESTEE